MTKLFCLLAKLFQLSPKLILQNVNKAGGRKRWGEDFGNEGAGVKKRERNRGYLFGQVLWELLIEI